MIYFRKGGGMAIGRGISGRRNNMCKCPVAGGSMASKGG